MDVLIKTFFVGVLTMIALLFTALARAAEIAQIILQ